MNFSRSSKKRFYSNNTMPPFFTAVLFIILIGFILIAKVMMHSSLKEITIPALSEDIMISKDSGLNSKEEFVLALLKDVIQPSERESRIEEKDANTVYYNTLKDYLAGDGEQLSEEQITSISGYIMSIKEILSSEGKFDYTRLSLDGKKVVFYLLGRIYKTCGLQLIGNVEENIETIQMHSGTILYRNADERQSKFQVDTLVIVMLFLFVLFISCLLLARKHQLFNKEEKYDGYDKERFA